jgi:hypothetical protein
MTQNSSHIFLNKLIVLDYMGTVAYDEKFHQGVNIIRGVNSSGKSTIANFIFFVLGGDFDNWTTAANKCKDVYAEVNINDVVITLRRRVDFGGNKPMDVFWGSFDLAKKNTIDWKTFPYRQTSNTLSFSNVIFQALNFPEIKSDADSNITMHQLLRLMYIDQDTPTQNLFRFERFDLPLTRQTIAEVLLGTYDDSLYYNRLNLRAAQKSQEDKKRQYENLNKLFNKSGTETSLEEIEKEIEKTRSDFSENEQQIIELKSAQKVKTTIRTVTVTEFIQEILSKTKNEIRDKQQLTDQLESEIFDSRQFVATLERRVHELNNSMLTRTTLGELPLTHCPHCLSLLDLSESDTNCILCKQPLVADAEKANAKRLLLEMELQIKESNSLLEEKEKHLYDLKGELVVLTQKMRLQQKNLDNSITTVQSTRDDRLDSFLIRKGELTRQLEHLADQIKIVSILQLLKTELEEIASLIQRYQLEIQEKENKQKSNFDMAMRKIKDYAFEILQKDLERQSEFKNGKEL